jgi:ribonuclease Z
MMNNPSTQIALLAGMVGTMLLVVVTLLLIPARKTANAAASETLAVYAASAAEERDQYIPNTEALGPDEMRVISLGTGMPAANKGQAAASFLVQLGNGENFIFDIGTNAYGNLTSLQIPAASLDKVFLGHLHFDHIGDLSALLIAAVSHGRNIPLQIWGPSGASPELGTRYAVDRLLEAFNWEFTSKRGKIPGAGYQAIVSEFDYTKTQVVYEENGVRITAWPAIHAIDGPVSYSLEWNGLKFVYSSDTYPNRWFMENGGDADILIHESFPTVQQLIDRNRMVPESAWPVGTRVHTQPAAAGKVFSTLEPRMAVAFHFASTFATRKEVREEIRTTYDGPLTVGKDLLVWNVTKDDVTVREALVPDVVWPTKSKLESAKYDPSEAIFPSDWLNEGRLDMSDVDAAIWSRLDPATQARIAEKLPDARPRSAPK